MATELPQLTPEEQKVRDFCDDLIKRSNVHEHLGREAFEAHFEEQMTSQLGSVLEPELISHYQKLALLFLFSEDPDHDELEAEKSRV